MTSRVLIVVGPSCSGKSTVSRIVADVVHARLFKLDSFWIAGCDKPTVNGMPTYERPCQYDGEALAGKVTEFLAREPDVPVVIEGFLALTYPSLLALEAVRIFLHLSPAEMRKRRDARAGASGQSGQGSAPRIEASWLANVADEWVRFGASQSELPGVIGLDADVSSGSLARAILGTWGR